MLFSTLFSFGNYSPAVVSISINKSDNANLETPSNGCSSRLPASAIPIHLSWQTFFA